MDKYGRWYQARVTEYLKANPNIMPSNAEMLQSAVVYADGTTLYVETPSPALRMVVSGWGSDGTPPPAPIQIIEGIRWPTRDAT